MNKEYFASFLMDFVTSDEVFKLCVTVECVILFPLYFFNGMLSHVSTILFINSHHPLLKRCC